MLFRSNNLFTGVFDGNGHTISNFTYDSNGTNRIGLFGVTINAEIKNLGLIDPNVSAGTGDRVGSLVGAGSASIANCYAEGGYVSGGALVGGLLGAGSGIISNCYSTTTVSGGEEVGGLAGYFASTKYTYSTMSNCYATGNVTGMGSLIGGLVGGGNADFTNCYAAGNVTGVEKIGGLVGDNSGQVSNSYSTGNVNGIGDYVGGLVGWNYYGTVSNSYVTGDVNGVTNVGGLVGWNDGTVSNSYATGSISGVNDIGGLVGYNGDTISNCYATSSVSGNDYVGGLVGLNYIQVVRNSYSAGDVNGVTNVGGLMGYNFGIPFTDSFWDVNSSGQTTSAGGTGKTTTEMQTKSTFTDADWDFVNVWDICEGTNYPKFVWQIPVGDFVCPDGVESNDLAVLVEQWLLEKLSADVAPDGGDGFVDFLDWAVFANGWQSTTDINDLTAFANQWLRFSAYSADIAPAPDGDSVVNLLDFAVLAENWLAGI